METKTLKPEFSEESVLPFFDEPVALTRFMIRMDQGAYSVTGRGIGETSVRPALKKIIKEARLGTSGVKGRGVVFDLQSQILLFRGLAELNRKKILVTQTALQKSFDEYCLKCGF